MVPEGEIIPTEMERISGLVGHRLKDTNNNQECNQIWSSGYADDGSV